MLEPFVNIPYGDLPYAVSTARKRDIALFQQLGMPGMTLKAVDTPAAPPPPLVYRCECGKAISRTKTWCMFCLQIHLMEIGEQINSQELLDAVVARNGHRGMTLEALKPYLKLMPEKPGDGSAPLVEPLSLIRRRATVAGEEPPALPTALESEGNPATCQIAETP